MNQGAAQSPSPDRHHGIQGELAMNSGRGFPPHDQA